MVVEWSIILKENLLLEELTLAKKNRPFCTCEMCIFDTSNKMPLSCKNGETPTWVVGSLLEREHIPKNTWKSLMFSSNIFTTTKNNPWESSMIVRVKPIRRFFSCFHFPIFLSFLFVFLFPFFMFFHFFSFFFSVVRADAKTLKKKCRKVPVVKMSTFLGENSILGPRWTGEGGVRNGPFEGDPAFGDGLEHCVGFFIHRSATVLSLWHSLVLVPDRCIHNV